MRLNNRVQREEKRESSAFRRAIPLVAGLALSAVLLFPTISQAQAHTCSAKVVNRTITAFQTHKVNKGKVTGLTLYVPAGKGKRIELQLPDSYVNDLVARSKKLPKEQRNPMVRAELSKTVEGAVATVNSNKRTFTCGSSAPRIKAAPAPAAAPATPKAASPAPKEETASGLREPLPPRKKGGKGTESSPYVIEIPVPAGTKKGVNITSKELSLNAVSQTSGKSVRIYFKLNFVTEPQSDKDYRSDPKKLTSKVASVMTSIATAHVRKQDPNAATVNARHTTVQREITSSARQKEGTIGKYLGIEASSQRRRTLERL
jgi:hypothetical protein